MACLLTIIGVNVVISGAFCLGCVLSILSESRLCCRRTLLLLIPLVLALEAMLVVVCWALA